MSKRVLAIIGAVVLVAFLVYVAVSSANGSYVAAFGIGSADVTASREGNAVVEKIRKLEGVGTATFAFTSGLFADRKSALSVTMRSSASLSEVEQVTALVRTEYNHGDGINAGAELAVVVPGAPRLELTDFAMSSIRLRQDLGAWDALWRATGTPISVQFGAADDRNLAFVSRKGASYSWIASHYSLLKALAKQGFTWTSPGVCSVGSLPDEAVIQFVARLSKIVPTVSCNSSVNQSGLVASPGGSNAVRPFVLVGFGTENSGQPFSAHAAQFAAVSRVLLDPHSPSANVGFFGAKSGKVTVLRFFTGSCADGTVTLTDPTDAASLAILKARGVDIVKHATLGQCSPKPAPSSPDPTPSG
jgi:hypothetical protein